MKNFMLALLGLSSLLIESNAISAEAQWHVQVEDPYVELHTGPGRGYPVFHVVHRGAALIILHRKTQWYKVKTEQGKEGWVVREQMEQTLTTDGTETRFVDVLNDNYQKRRFELGLATGLFQDDPIVEVHGGYRFNDAFLLELMYGSISGTFSSSTIYHLGLVSQPFPDWSWQPNFSIGFGQLDNVPQASLVGGQKTQNTLFSAGLGIRKYISRSFLFRVDFRDYLLLVEDDRNEEYHSLTAGFSVFF